MYISPIRRGQEAYYFNRPGEVAFTSEEQLAMQRDGANPQAGLWLGSGRYELGLGAGVEASSISALMAGRDPSSGELLGRAHMRVKNGAFDLIFGAPKAVSVIWALGDSEVRRSVWSAHLEAVGETLGAMEGLALSVRRRAGGNDERIGCRGAIAASFLHGLSRAGDPHLHSHVVLANLARGDDGLWSAIDSTSLYAFSKAAGAGYNAHLRWVLSQQLGVRFSATEQTWGIQGLPKALLGEFSQRRQQVLSQLESWGTSGHGARAAAAFATRNRMPLDPVAVHQRWTERATRYGVGSIHKEDLAQSAARAPIPPRSQPMGALDAASKGSGYFRRADIFALIAEGARGGMNWTELEKQAGVALAAATEVRAKRTLSLYAPKSTTEALKRLVAQKEAFQMGANKADEPWSKAVVLCSDSPLPCALAQAVSIASRAGQSVGVFTDSGKHAALVELLTGVIASPRLADLGFADVVVVSQAASRHPAELQMLSERGSGARSTMFLLDRSGRSLPAAIELRRLAGGSLVQLDEIKASHSPRGRLVRLGPQDCEVLVAQDTAALLAAVAEGVVSDARSGLPPVALLADKAAGGLFEQAIRSALRDKGVLGEERMAGKMPLCLGEQVILATPGRRATLARVVGIEETSVSLVSARGQQTTLLSKDLQQRSLRYGYALSEAECLYHGLSPRIVVGGAELTGKLQRNSGFRYHAVSLRDHGGRDLAPSQLYGFVNELVGNHGKQGPSPRDHYGPARRLRLRLEAQSISISHGKTGPMPGSPRIQAAPDIARTAILER